MTRYGGIISICICTFKRPLLLERLLAKIQSQCTDGLFKYSVVIVDNDSQGSGRLAVDNASRNTTFPIYYDIEPERSISLARNRTLRNAKGNLIAFIDDDEFPDDHWLMNHYKTLLTSGADGVLGPVKPHFEKEAPVWLIKSGLLDRKCFNTGEVLKDYRYTRTGNALLWKTLFDTDQGAFDPAYGRSGGSDAIFFKRMMEKGKTFVWSNEGLVYETVLEARQTRMYYVKRAFTRGMTEAWQLPFLSFSTAKSLVAFSIYFLLLPFCPFIGQGAFMRYLIKSCDHLGKIMGYLKITPVKERPY